MPPAGIWWANRYFSMGYGVAWPVRHFSEDLLRQNMALPQTSGSRTALEWGSKRREEKKNELWDFIKKIDICLLFVQKGICSKHIFSDSSSAKCTSHPGVVKIYIFFQHSALVSQEETLSGGLKNHRNTMAMPETSLNSFLWCWDPL